MTNPNTNSLTTVLTDADADQQELDRNEDNNKFIETIWDDLPTEKVAGRPKANRSQ